MHSTHAQALFRKRVVWAALTGSAARWSTKSVAPQMLESHLVDDAVFDDGQYKGGIQSLQDLR